MKKLLHRIDWLTGLLIFAMPICLVFFLGVQMASSEVQSEYESYAALVEYTSVANLQPVAAGSTVLLRGAIVDPATVAALPPQPTTEQAAGALLIYQERPLDGREVRYLEEFPLIFPAVALKLADGNIIGVQPSEDGTRTISHEAHRVTLADRAFTGFQIGDTITVQGKWQPMSADRPLPFVVEVTGISGADKAALQAEVQAGLQKVSLSRDGLGLLTLAGIVLLVFRVYRQRRNPPTDPMEQLSAEGEESQTWRPPTTETVPTT